MFFEGAAMMTVTKEDRRRAYHDRQERALGPTPERLAKANGAFEIGPADEIDRRTGEVHTFRRYRMTDKSLLERLFIRGMRVPREGISADQYRAGMRYYEDAFLSGVTVIRVPDLSKERVDGGRNKGISDHVLEASTRFAKALQFLTPEHKIILSHVIFAEAQLDKFVGEDEFPQQRERRAIALKDLWRALNKLVEYYNQIDGIRPRKPKIEVMHEPGYRPNIIKGGAADDR